ncbi:MAG TPA: preprotein translocase subunit SecG [Alphaproteobacteria bacterium]|nr:preprotein translocase subunit SecG [Alphaproteobacteria bacterium]
MGSVLLVLQLIVAIFLVVVILMQRSNGGALSGLGGDSGVGSILSARGKGNILTRITAILATLFFVLSMALSIYYSRMEVKTSSILDKASAAQTQQAPAQEAPAEEAPSEPEVPVAE